MRRSPCKKCPKFSCGWCPVKAKRVSPLEPCCDAGLRLVKNAYVRGYRAKKAKTVKKTSKLKRKGKNT